MTKDANLQYFNPKKPLTLEVYASKLGIGVALLQDSKVICNSDHQPSEKIHLKHLSDAHLGNKDCY